jgi:hypothetical protein
METLLKWVNTEPTFRRFQLMCNPSKVNCWSIRIWSTFEDGSMRKSPAFGYGISIEEAFADATKNRVDSVMKENKIL